MDDNRLKYFRNEIRAEADRQWDNFTDEMVDEVVKRILNDYDVADLNDRDFDAFIDSGCIESIVELVGIDMM
ncbi:MAG: hypothetical protein K0R18_412 [Bacillales bacterium]|jgi:hypothetical protein|nr:hypothetical protein [Bacillales bacterium]